MDINYEYYRVFYYAAKYKNLTKAAQALHSSQPNVSRVIRLLEDEMGCRLLIRTNRGISLTLEGERLYFHVKSAVEQLQAAETEIAELTGKRRGSVTIGASETALRMALLPALSEFKRCYPETKCQELFSTLLKKFADRLPSGRRQEPAICLSGVALALQLSGQQPLHLVLGGLFRLAVEVYLDCVGASVDGTLDIGDFLSRGVGIIHKQNLRKIKIAGLSLQARRGWCVTLVTL